MHLETSSVKELDSVVLRVTDLGAAVSAYETLFGTEAVRGRVGERDAALFVLGNVTFEVVEASAEAGLGALRFLVDDLESVRSSGISDAASWQADGAAAQQRSLVRIDPSSTGGQPIELVERPWSAPAAGASSADIHALDHAVVRTRDADAARGVYEGQLGIRVAFDRSFEQWSTRLIMCKLGAHDTVIEIAARLSSDADDEVSADAPRDALWGFTWRVADLPAAHARLDAAGVELSPIRKGRRPGTRVATVRNSGTVDVPTLLIGPDEPSADS